MASIKISDLNQDDLEMLSNLTDEELVALYGGGFWNKLTNFIHKLEPVVNVVAKVAPVVIAIASAV